MNINKLYLVGFMDSEITTLGRELADQLRWDFLIFKNPVTQNEEVRTTRPIVIATAGGLFTQTRVRDFILQDGLVVWSFTPFDTIIDRLWKPDVLKERPMLQFRIREMKTAFESYRRAYEQAHMIVGGQLSAAEVAANIIRKRRRHF